MDDHIYVMTHKTFTPPEDPLYLPIHVGRTTWLREHDRTQSVGDRPESVGDRPESVGDRPESVGDRPESVGDRPESAGNKPASAGCKPTSDGRDGLLCFQGDDTGDNISDQNCYFSELTGMYWVWKNVSSDVVGICHYRRYLLDHDGCLFTEASIAPVLANHDVITTKNLQLNFPYEEGFASHHKRIYLDTTAEVLRELYPEYDRTYKRLVHEKHTYFGNMLIMKKTLYDAYMEWLFAILFGVQKRVKVEEEDSYHRRIFGFVSEFLQYVWIVHNNLKVYECMVGMLGEKAEVTETKQRLAEYFAKGDFAGARQYFLAARKCRPDILMEASDVTGELHLCMEVIAIAGLEQEAYGTNLLQKNRDFMELMRYCNHLNRYAFQKRSGHIEHELAFWVQEQGVTEVALRVAEAVTGAMGQGEKMYSVI